MNINLMSSATLNPFTLPLEQIKTRIMSGKPVSTDNSSVVEVLISDGSSSGICTGSLLSKTKVLTAAHCAELPGKMSVMVGNEKIGVKAVSVHPEARIDEKNGVLYNDVAILDLKSAAKAPPIPILTSKKIKSGDQVKISGFGLDEKHSAGTLREGKTIVSSVNSNFITTLYEKPGSNTCNGDSGGPAIMSYKQDGKTITGLVGVTSTGEIPGCTIGDHSNFVNLQSKKVLDFIKSRVPGLKTD